MMFSSPVGVTTNLCFAKLILLIRAPKSLSMQSMMDVVTVAFIKISRAIFLVYFSKFNAPSKLALSEWQRYNFRFLS
jgi:hypothetical protein